TAPSLMVLAVPEEGDEPDDVDVDLPQAARTSARKTNSQPDVRRIRLPMRDSWATTAGNGTNFLEPSPETDSASTAYLGPPGGRRRCMGLLRSRGAAGWAGAGAAGARLGGTRPGGGGFMGFCG